MPDFNSLKGMASSAGSPTVLLKPSPSTGQLQAMPRTVSGSCPQPQASQAGQALFSLEESLLLPSSMSPGYCLLRVGKRPACTAG